jgi:hypothetical protein
MLKTQADVITHRLKTMPGLAALFGLIDGPLMWELSPQTAEHLADRVRHVMNIAPQWQGGPDARGALELAVKFIREYGGLDYWRKVYNDRVAEAGTREWQRMFGRAPQQT